MFVCRYLFHYICEDGITYMCMADDSFGRRIPFIFLQDLKERFLSSYGKTRALEAPPYGLNEFSRVIEKQMVKEDLTSYLCIYMLFLGILFNKSKC